MSTIGCHRSARVGPVFSWLMLFGLVTLLVAPLQSGAQATANHRRALFTDAAAALTPQQLDRLRGGFKSADGFDFSFGMRNLRQVNGEARVEQTLFQVDNLIAKLHDSSAGATIDVTVPRRSAVEQRGPGNVVAPSVLSGGTGLPRTIIQNSLDHQTINNATVYDFRLSNIKALTRNLNASVRRATVAQPLVDSIR